MWKFNGTWTLMQSYSRNPVLPDGILLFIYSFYLYFCLSHFSTCNICILILLISNLVGTSTSTSNPGTRYSMHSWISDHVLWIKGGIVQLDTGKIFKNYF